jgi:flagellar protein FliO/FliZ
MKCVQVLMLSLLSSMALANNNLQGVETGVEDGKFVATYKFTGPVDAQAVTLDVQDKSVQVMIPEGQMPTDKNLVRVDSSNVQSIYTTLEAQGQIRSKVIFDKAVAANDMKNSVRVAAEGSTLKVYIKKPDEVWSSDAFADVAPNALDAQAEAAVTDPVVESVKAEVAKAVAAKVEVGPAVATETKKESEIPVLAGATNKKAESVNPFTRMIVSLIVICVLGGGLVFFSRWYSSKHKKSADNNRIRILAQHHLGPRKSLAIIRVAGESILIGITDQNISMIKALSLIDDEVPEVVSQDFQKSLATADQNAVTPKATKVTSAGATKAPADDVDEFVMSNIKDKITSKLKSMRTI